MSNLRCSLINARSIKGVGFGNNQLLSLKSELYQNNVDLFAITESWLNDTIEDNELLVSGYNFFRKDRQKRGGGILLYMNDSITCIRRLDLEPTSSMFDEIMVCELKLTNESVYVILFYRPPNASFNFNANLCQVLLNVQRLGKNSIYVMGDLNMPHVNWSSLTSTVPIEQDLCEILDRFNITQINKNPSRDVNPNILDIVASNKPLKVSEIDIGCSLIDTDHKKLNFSINVLHKKDKQCHPTRRVFLFKHANWDEINYHLNNSDLSDIILNNINNPNIAWLKWKGRVLDVINKYIPSKIFKIKNSAPWIDSEIITLSKKKETLRKIAKRTNTSTDWAKYKTINNKVKNLVNKKHSNFINNCFEEINSNPKKFWSFVSQKGNRGSIPNEISLDNETASDSNVKANLFNKHFFNQFNSKKLPVPNDLPSFINDNLSSIILTEFQVYNVLCNLDVNKAYGSDGLATAIYKHCAISITPSLTMLFNLSLDKGIVPNDWKKANIVPVFKKGVKSDVKNYRPISLLPIAGKVLERCVHHSIFNIIRNDINEHQHGFVPQKSTTSQLVEFYDLVFNKIDNKSQCDIIFLDLSKAFDSVPHDLLLAKLKTFGICNKLHAWFTDYLHGRQQKVVIQGCSSVYKPVMSGVPQGSILGPLLFNLYINDLHSCIENNQLKLYLYADDSKLLHYISNQQDCIELQNALDSLLNWSLTWGLRFNPDKCTVMTVSRSRVKIMYDYKIRGQKLNRVTKCMDLGILVNENLSWDEHISMMVNKANKRLGYLKRSIGFNCNVKTKLTCYKALIRPILESGSNVWACVNKKNILKLESVQRRATKFILKDYHSDYDVRLMICDILPLTLRRDFLDLVLFYNYLNDISLIKLNVTFVNTQNIHNTRNLNDELTLIRPRCSTLGYSKFYTNRISYIWNNVPYEVRNSELSDTGKNTCFKTRLKEHLVNYFTNSFIVENTCTWQLHCGCSQCALA